MAAPAVHVEPFPVAPDVVGTTAGSFRVDESGNANYSTRIATGPAVAGVAPSVGLSYTSQAANGQLGIGWKIDGLSSITRCRQTPEQDAVNGGIQFDSNDRFCLDGQRLVLMQGSNYMAAGAQYVTEIDSQTRVTAVGFTAGAPVSFKVQRKDGSVSFYGATTDSILKANDNGALRSEVFSWAINRREDNLGNAIDYVYVTDDLLGSQRISRINYAPGNSIRFDYEARQDTTLAYVAGGQFKMMHRLSKVRSLVGSSELRSYQLTYQYSDAGQSRIVSLQESVGPQKLKPVTFEWANDAFDRVDVGSYAQSYPVGFESAKFEDIDADGRQDMLYVQNRNTAGGSRFVIRQLFGNSSGTAFSSRNCVMINLSYVEEGNSFRQAPWQLQDINADGHADLLIKDLQLEQWQVYYGGQHSNGCIDNHAVNTQADGVFGTFQDFTGDAKIDMLYKHKTNGRFYLRTGKDTGTATNLAHFNAPVEVQMDLPIKPAGAVRSIEVQRDTFLEADGDGRADLSVKVTDKSECAVTWTEVFQGGNMYWKASVGYGCEQNGKYSVDDYYTRQEPGVRYIKFDRHYLVMKSVGDVHNNDFRFVVHTQLQAITAGIGMLTEQWVDLNNDGLTDVLYSRMNRRAAQPRKWYFRLNTGKLFLPEVHIDTIADDRIRVQPVDINADGYLDLAYVNSGVPSGTSGNILGTQVYQIYDPATARGANPYTRFSMIYSSYAGRIPVNHGQVFHRDLNGDGNVDFLFINPHMVNSHDSNFKFQLARPASPYKNRVIAIDNGLGSRTSIDYRALNSGQDFYERSYGQEPVNWGSGSPVYNLYAASYVVSRVTSSAATATDAAASLSIDYRYGHARAQAGGRGMLGYEWLETKDVQSGVVTRTTYRQDHPYSGTPLSTRMSLNSKIFSESFNTYAYQSTHGGRSGFVYLAESIEKSYDVLAGVGSLPIKTVVTSQDYGLLASDANAGNRVNQQVKIYAGDVNGTLLSEKTTVSQYQDDVTKWYLGRLSHTAVTHSRPGKTSVVKTAAFEYDAVNGLLKKETIEPDAADISMTLVTAYQHDAHGNVIKKTTCSMDVADCGTSTLQQVDNPLHINRWATTEYDASGAYVNKTLNQYGQVMTEVLSRDVAGRVLQVRSLNGVITDTRYDAFGAAYFSRSSTGSWSHTQRIACSSHCGFAPAVMKVITTGAGAKSISYIDAAGREIASQVENFEGTQFITVQKQFDRLGRNIRVSEPYFSAEGSAGMPQYWTVTDNFDVVSRPGRVTSPNGRQLTIVRTGFTTVNTQIAVQGGTVVKTEVNNALGELIEVSDDSGTIQYSHDLFGNLEDVTHLNQSYGQQSHINYDSYGRKVSMWDVDKGGKNKLWQYEYNAAGELIKQVDAKGQVIETRNDALGRKVSVRDYSVAGGAVVNESVWQYDNTTLSGSSAGQLKSENLLQGGQFSRTLSYDSFGRLVQTLTQIDGQDFLQETVYDQYGRVFQQFDSTGKNAGTRNRYNARGYLTHIYDARGDNSTALLLRQMITMDPRGNVTEEKTGNDLTTTRTYQASTGKLNQIRTVDASLVTLQQIDYAFDDYGNLKSRQNINGNSEQFDYDSLHRLVSINGQLEASYSANGNILSKRKNSAGGASTLVDYQYGGSCNGVTAGPHAVTSADGHSYCYDANGNQLSGAGRNIVYSIFDKAISLTKAGHQTTFAYNTNRSRYKRVDTKNNVTTTTYYVGNVEVIHKAGEPLLYRRSVAGAVVNEYRDNQGEIAKARDSRFLHTDHLGSTDVISDNTGAVYQQFSFDAWGKQRDPVSWNSTGDLFAINLSPFSNAATSRGFTGHEHLDEMGLVHMNGRIYDVNLGRFIQADPIIQSPDNSQSFNRYSYVINNPLRYTDPSGFNFMDKVAEWMPVIMAIIITAATSGAGAPIGQAIAGGAIAGWVASGFTLRGAAIGAFTAGAFYGVGEAIQTGQIVHQAGQAVAHGIVGGISSILQGGKFGHGFAAAAVTKSFSESIGNIGSKAGRIFAASLLGGTVSSATGGKFANGAITAAFSRAFNEGMHEKRKNLWDDHIKLTYSDEFLEKYQKNNPLEYALFKEFTSGIDITNFGNPSDLLFDIDSAANIAFDGWAREKSLEMMYKIVGNTGESITDSGIPQTTAGKAGIKTVYDLTSGIVLNQKNYKNYGKIWMNGPEVINEKLIVNELLNLGASKKEILTLKKISRNYWKPKNKSRKR